MNMNNIIGNDGINPQFIFLEKIKAMLITIVEKEKINNSYKIALLNNPNLNLINYFIEIDQNQKSYIVINDLKNYLNINSIEYSEHTLRKFIHLFDKQNKFNLTYEDFIKIFSPYNMDTINNNIDLNNEKEIFINIINGYLELAEQINEMIINIRKTNNFTTYEAFMGISKGNKYLDEEFLEHFLEHNYNCDEIRNLIYLIDSNNDRVISYEEFQDFFIPLLDYNDGNINNNILNNENNDLVNFEKSGKFGFSQFERSNNKNINNRDNDNNNKSEENMKEDTNNLINKEDKKEENYNENYDNNLKENDNNIKNDNYNINSSQEENKDKCNNNDSEKNIINDDDYDKYCNFYRKTKQFLSPPYNYYNQKNVKQNSNSDKKNNDNKELNIIHSEMQFIPNKKQNKDFSEVKNNEVISSENKKIIINNFNTAEKENNSTNINNFTCGKKIESDMGNSSSKKINININSNDLENYSLSNEYNNINNNIISQETNNKIFSSKENIIISNEKNKDKDNDTKEDINKRLSSDKEVLVNIQKNDFEEKEEGEEENINSKKINPSLSSFIKYIQYLLSKEKYTFDLKDNLSLREDMTLKDIFCIFDYNKKNNITKKEFKVVCKKIFGLYPTTDQVNLVFKRYDKDRDENLNLKEFLDMIKPLKEEYACFLFNKNKREGNNNINMKSKKILNDVIRAIIEDEGYYYKFKDDLENKNLFDLEVFWKTIVNKINNEKGIDKLEMFKLLNDNGFSLSQYDIDIIFNKMDFDKDDIIGYNDLAQEFVNYY